ncbi:MAG: hypothetical protein JXB29_08645, partial [Sedimentisphaerales bacterium]|nr:hypothetical protein [Sedimentisphaerales bacterium]
GYITCPVIYFGLNVNWVWLGSVVNFVAIPTGYISSLIYRWVKKDYEYSIYTWRYRGSQENATKPEMSS